MVGEASDESEPARKRPLDGKENSNEARSPVNHDAAAATARSVRNPYSSTKKKAKRSVDANNGGYDDDDVEIVSPPPRPGSSRAMAAAAAAAESLVAENQPPQNPAAASANNANDDCVVEWSNTTNANVDLPHARPNCGVHSFAEANKQQCCDKCYCLVCDKPAKGCTAWASHCQVTLEKHQRQKMAAQEVIDIEDSPEPAAPAGNNFYAHQIDPAVQSYYARQGAAGMTRSRLEASLLDQDDSSTDNANGDGVDMAYNKSRKNGMASNAFEGHFTKAFNDQYDSATRKERGRNPKDMRITEVLAEKLMNSLQLAEVASSSSNNNNQDKESKKDKNSINNKSSSNGSSSAKEVFSSLDLQRKERFERSKMDGDVPQLGLHTSFFVEGVRIGWPYPSILKPQRQMAIHLIKALKNSRHVVLESPTGTGKSAAILCAVLSWQRFHARSIWGKEVADHDKVAAVARGEETTQQDPFPRIIYCSRTHSQVAQMVASLKKTPYRPRMTVLGSRDRLCIHQNIRDKNASSQGADQGKGKSRVNVNTACRQRVANTEKMRKALWKSHDYKYKDDDPPEDVPGDKGGNQGGSSQQDDDDDDDDDGDEGRSGDRASGEWIMKNSTKKLTCPHYRQLSTARTAQMARETFLVTQDKVDCCGSGGEKTSLGVHDIEDLVKFGVDPYLKKIALYRKRGETSFGIDVGNDCKIALVKKDSAAESNGQLRRGDKIIAVNGRKIFTLRQVTEAISKCKDPLEITVLKKKASTGFNFRANADAPGPDETGFEEKDVALNRARGEKSFGMVLEGTKPGGKGCVVNAMKVGGAARRGGLLKAGDYILQVNGKDVADLPFDRVVDEIKMVIADPLMVRVRRHAARASPSSVDFDDDEEDLYSSHAACPYYLSRALSKTAELIFAPYNYVLDPGIRAALDIDLKGSIVILDEAHNVEGTLTESGSIKVGEIELSKLLAMLAHHSSGIKSRKNSVEMAMGDKLDVTEVAHELLLFVEKIVLFLRQSREKFERAKGNIGAAKAIEEYHKFRSTPDNNEFEVSYQGPNGHGVRNKAVGCQPFFDAMQITAPEIAQLFQYSQEMESHLSGGDPEKRNASSNGEGASDQGTKSMFDLLNGLVSKFNLAVQTPEHFYVSCVIQANGNLDYAGGTEGEGRGRTFKKKPTALPFISPRSERNPNAALPCCTHTKCRKSPDAAPSPLGFGSGIRHGDWCDGRHSPPWEAHLILKLLLPGLLMKDLSTSCRSVVLASGSLSPLQSLCAELDLQDAESSKTGRLQTKPRPLEADHVITKQKQLLAMAVGTFPNGDPLTVNYNNYKDPRFFGRLGDAVANVVEAIPRGGVLIFLPSYSMLNKCLKCWKPFESRTGYRNVDSMEHSCPQIWERLLQSKGKVIVEPSGNQELFEAARDEYAETIKTEGSCILLAVFRGKMSEGISFNDDNARGVICVGIPFPNARDRSILAKKSYNDEQRKLKKKTGLLPGQDWYSQEAFRAIAQALGRCIRHDADYGTVVLMDSRHCNDGSPGFVHKKLPKWMRDNVRTLSMGNLGRGHDPVLGGYQGLRREMDQFFAQAPAHAQSVLERRQRDLAAAQARDSQSASLKFNSKTGNWTADNAATTGQPSTTAATTSGCCGSVKRITQDSPMPPAQLHGDGQLDGEARNQSQSSTDSDKKPCAM